MAEALGSALALVASGDASLLGIVALSLAVSLSAVLLATLFGLPLGAALAVARFPGRRAIIVLYEIEGATIPAIARLLGVAAVTVRWHLSIGRRELAAAVDGRPARDPGGHHD